MDSSTAQWFEQHLACTPDGRLLAWYDQDGILRVSDLQARETVREFPPQPPALSENCRVWRLLLALSPDGRYVAWAYHRKGTHLEGEDDAYPLQVHEVTTGRQALGLDLRQADGRLAPVACLAFGPNGRTLAVGRDDEAVVPDWEIASGQERHTFSGHRSGVTSLAFAPDGKSLASGSCDTTILVWDLDGSRTGEATGRPGLHELETLWADLGADAARAGKAICLLARHPAEAVPFLAARLKPAASPKPERLAQLIVDLGDGRFAARERAGRELEQLHWLAEPALRQALVGAVNLETRRRLEKLLRKLQGPVTMPALLREVRSVEALERGDTPEARKALQSLAAGALGARLTAEARAALHRLGGVRPAAGP